MRIVIIEDEAVVGRRHGPRPPRGQGGQQDRGDEADRLVAQVAEAMSEPRIDYVRLNVEATRP